MEPIFTKKYHIDATETDCTGRLKLSRLLGYAQNIAGEHCDLLGTNRDALEKLRLCWVVIRQRVQITRLPGTGENITLETWPMPTTRTAYPRATVARDADGKELFRCVSLWVLMDLDSRTMVLPGKSSVSVDGILRGSELAAPGSLAPRDLENTVQRTVRFTDLDVNSHMNNCRYLDWVADLLPGSFHREHPAREFSICYLSELTEGARAELRWELKEDGSLYVDSKDADSDAHRRIFAAKLQF